MTSTAGATPHTNARQAELDKFGALASRWWDTHGPQKPLHAMNPVRLRYVSNHVNLSGAQVADIGCGGGLLSEAMARAGAKVTAVDLSPELVEVANLHALETGAQVDYRVTSAEALAQAEPAAFDVVTCMELIEHVPDPQSVLDACAALLKPGGALFVSTLNRTPAAFGLAIVGAEYIARLLPHGTHQYRDFIRPAELARGMREAGLEPSDASGVLYEPWRNSARLWPRMDINYLMMAKKPA